MKEISIKELHMNPYTLFSENWAALCSGSAEDGFNAMTIAWGQIGSLWERKTHSNRLPVATVYVRQSRYGYAEKDGEDKGLRKQQRISGFWRKDLKKLKGSRYSF